MPFREKKDRASLREGFEKKWNFPLRGGVSARPDFLKALDFAFRSYIVRLKKDTLIFLQIFGGGPFSSLNLV